MVAGRGLRRMLLALAGQSRYGENAFASYVTHMIFATVDDSDHCCGHGELLGLLLGSFGWHVFCAA